MADSIGVLIVDDVLETRENVAKLLSFEEDIRVVGEATNGKEAVVLAKRLKPDVVLMDINMPVMGGIEATEQIALEVPQSTIIIMSVQGEQEYLREAMIAGAREYLVKPFSGDELVNTIRKVYEAEMRRRQRQGDPAAREASGMPEGKIISVFSTKGGVGRTTLAVNLATSIAASNPSARVVIVDLDLQFGDVALMMDVSPKRTFADLAREDSIDSEMVTGCLVSHPRTSVKVLPAPLRPEQAEVIGGKHVESVLRLLKSLFDYIVVDLPASLQDTALVAMDLSDLILVVAALDLPTIKNAKLCLEVMESLNYPAEKVKLVVNRVSRDIGVRQDDLEKTLNRKVDFVVPADGKIVVPSVNTGVPFVLSHPNSRAGQAVRQIAREIVARPRTSKETSRQAQASARLRGVFVKA